MTIDLPEGWGFPAASRKAHYYRAGDSISLCNGWMYTGSRDPADSEPSPDDCAQCTRRLKAQREAAELGLGFTALGMPIKPYFGRRSYNDPGFRDTKPKTHAFDHRQSNEDGSPSVFNVVAKCGYVASEMLHGLRWTKQKPRKIDFCEKCQHKINEENES